MPSMIEIRHHIRAVEQTRKITNAMNLISSARMKKAMPHVEYNRRYTAELQDSMHDLLAAADSFDYRYLRPRLDTQNTYIVIAGDKGMVGAYNNDLFKFALPYVAEHPERHLITLGITTSFFFRKNGMPPDIEFLSGSQDPTVDTARHIMQDIVQFYDNGVTDQVYIIYTRFVNSARWYPVIKRLLPIETDNIRPRSSDEQMIYHPNARELFHQMVPQYTLSLIYGAMMNAYASEHCARMNAMSSATRNADELLKKLSQKYNMARQAAITREITEITGAAQALTGKEASL